MKTFALVFLFFSFFLGFSQSKKPTKKDFQSVQNLSAFLCKETNSDKKKVQSIYKWVTRNIAHDFDVLYNDKPSFSKNAEDVLESGYALAPGYVALTQALLQEQNIETEMIVGYGRPLLKDTILLPVYTDHAWIAININGDWKLADPMLDAGYIGYQRTDKVTKVYKMKRKWRNKQYKTMHKLQAKKNSGTDSDYLDKMKKKEMKAKMKLEKKRLELMEKIDRMPDFTNEVVFNWVRGNRYFFIDADSFVLSHYPIQPMWQLKEDTIDLSVFLSGREAIKEEMSKTDINNLDFKTEIDKYRSLDYYQKHYSNASIGLKLNPKNNKIKAENTYLELRSLFDKKDFNAELMENDSRKYDEKTVLQLMDTSLIYIDLSSDNQSAYFKYLKSYYRELNQEGKDYSNKQYRKMSKALSWNEIATNDIDRAWENIERYRSKWKKIKGRLYTYPGINYRTDSFNISEFKTIEKQHADSLKALFELVNHRREIWHCQQIRSALIGIEEGQKKQNELLAENAEFLGQRTLADNSIVCKNFESFSAIHDYMELMYSDSLKKEMYCKDYVNSVNNFYNYCKKVKTELESNSTNIGFDEQRYTTGMLNGYSQLQIDRLLDDLVQADLHFYWLKTELQNIKAYWEKLLHSTEYQVILQERKKTFNVNYIEVTEDREKNTLRLMKNDIRRWKSMLRSSFAAR